MKKIISILLASLLCAACFSGCKTKEERANAAAEEMRQQVEEAQRKYDQLNREIEAYKRASDKLNNAK